MCREDDCFPGIYCFDMISKPWLSDGFTMIFSSIWGSKEVILSVNMLRYIKYNIINGEFFFSIALYRFSNWHFISLFSVGKFQESLLLIQIIHGVYFHLMETTSLLVIYILT